MSVSMVLAPVGLAMRIIMGKDNFNNWVNSMLVMVPTNFTDELEIISTVRSAGFDTFMWGNGVKTHLNGEKQFFFWNRVDGQWRAVFTKYDSQETINSFINQVENSAGRPIFTFREEGQSLMPDKITSSFPTNFNDREILMQTLKEYEADPLLKPNGEIVCKLDSIELTFKPATGGPYSVEITTTKDISQAHLHLVAIDDDYKHNIQSATYVKLKQRISQHNLVIESEEVMEDNSIVLTINIMG